MIKKFNEFVNEGMMSKMWRELDGTEIRDEEIKEQHIDVNIKGVDGNHSFTDARGILHKNGYKVNNINIETLRDLIKILVKARGNTCSLNDIDVSNFNTFDKLFQDYRFFDFDGDISGWDVSNVTEFSYMFYGSDFTGKNSDLNRWNICTDTKKRVYMDGMFAESNFCGDISKWDVSRVIDMSDMFCECKNFNGDLSKWDVSNVIHFNEMFKKSGFTGENGDIGNWKFYKGEETINFRDMFSTTNFKGDLSKWEIYYDQRINIIDMFAGSTIRKERQPKWA